MFLLKIKNTELILLVSVLLAATLFTTNANSKPRDYVLQCRGGGNMFARVSVHYRNWVNIYMKHAKYAASKTPPGAGECAWIDRAMSNNEPNELWYDKTGNGLFHHIDITPRKVNISYTSNPIVDVLKKMRTGRMFFVHVTSIPGAGANKRVLKITRIGP